MSSIAKGQNNEAGSLLIEMILFQHSFSPWSARWSKSREPTSCSATTAFFWRTASTSPWCRRSATYLTDCLWSLPTGTAKQHARSRTHLVLCCRISRDPRRPLPRPPRTPNPPSQRSCQPKTSYTDWTCKLNNQSRRRAGWKKRKWGEVLNQTTMLFYTFTPGCESIESVFLNLTKLK